MLAALCFVSVLALSLGSYITVCYRTLELSSRTMQSTRSVELAEAGLEEALWALNKDDWSTWTVAGATATKTLTGFSFDGGASGTVELSITNYDGSDLIAGVARTVRVTGTVVQSDGTTVSRTLTSSSQPAPLFVNAVAAVGSTGRVRFRSGGTVDSYDSSLEDSGGNLIPYASQTPGFSAIVSSASTSTTTDPIQLTNAQVKGYVSNLLGLDGITYSASAKIVGPTTPAATKIDSERISVSPYQPVFDEIVPSGAGTTLPSGAATIGTAGATSPTLYYATDLALSGSSQILTIDGPVIISVSDDVTIASNARIRITSNGSLRLHLGGDLSIKGNGIENQTLRPKNLIIINTRTTWESYEMSTSQPFYGVIYTPVSSLTINTTQTIYGAIVAKSVTTGSSVSPVIHYDISLRNEVFDGIDIPFAITDWRETDT